MNRGDASQPSALSPQPSVVMGFDYGARRIGVAVGNAISNSARAMIVCVCHRVSDRDIGRAVREGCTDFDTLQAELRVGTACGACVDCAGETFRACLSRGVSRHGGRDKQSKDCQIGQERLPEPCLSCCGCHCLCHVCLCTQSASCDAPCSSAR